jgi:hypothetical protein
VTDDMAEVVSLAAWQRGSGRSSRLESLRDAVEGLGELECCLRQLVPQQRWSVRRWRIASTPFRALLIGAREGLSDLRRIRPADEQNAMSWKLEFNDACFEAEGRLRDIGVCVDMLQRADASPAERAREIEIFAASRSMLLKTLSRIRYLANQDFVTELGEN